MTKGMKFFVYALLILAAIGLISKLILNPAGFIKGIFMMVGFAVVLGLLVYYFLTRNHRGSSNSQYRKAVKQSRKKYGKKGNNREAFLKTNINRPSKVQKNSRKSSHLTVIKGNKK